MKKCFKNQDKVLSRQYSFSKHSNKVRVVCMTPNKFLKETYKEVKRKSDMAREGEKFSEKYLDKKTQYPTKVYKSYKKYVRDVLIEKNVHGIKEVIEGKKESKYKIPIPFLEYDQFGRPSGHEGRHTAEAFKRLKIKKIPVTIVKRRK